MSRVVTAGETMALLDPVREGELELGDMLRLRFAGAESNFAVGLARLGVDVAWISRLGGDRLGALIRDALAGEGVDLRWVAEDDAPTGLFYKWRADGRTSVAYHRRGSAASRLSPADAPGEALAGAALVHLTGITMALGDGPRALVLDLARRAREAGRGRDLRPELPAGAVGRPGGGGRRHGAGARARELVPVRRAGRARRCSATTPRARWPRAASTRWSGPPPARRSPRAGRCARSSRAGARRWSTRSAPATRSRPASPTGCSRAGIRSDCVRAAHAIAAWALRGTGDWETLPRLDEVRDLLPG